MENVSSVIESICKDHGALVELIKLDILYAIKNYTSERSGEIVENPTTGVSFIVEQVPDNSWDILFADILPGVTEPKEIDRSPLGVVISTVVRQFVDSITGSMYLKFDLVRDKEDQILLSANIKDTTEESIYKVAATIVSYLKLYTSLYPDETATVIENIFEKENLHSTVLATHRNYKTYAAVVETSFKDNDLLNAPDDHLVEVRSSLGDYFFTLGTTDGGFILAMPDNTDSYGDEVNLTALSDIIFERMDKELGIDSLVGVGILTPFVVGGPKHIACLFRNDPTMVDGMGFVGTFLICHLGILEGKVPGLPTRDSEALGPVKTSPFFEAPQTNFS